MFLAIPPAPPRGFKAVPGFSGYAISRSGILLTCRRGIRGRVGELASHMFRSTWRVYRPTISIRDKARGRGIYLTAKISAPGHRPHRVGVSTLVLITFVGPKPPGMEACHNNGISTDNRRRNLRWDTRKGNEADKITHGTHVHGQRARNAKLTDAIVRSVRASALANTVLAARHGVAVNTLRHARIRKTWKHVR